MIFTIVLASFLTLVALLLHPRILGFILTFALRNAVRLAIKFASGKGYLGTVGRVSGGGAVRGGEKMEGCGRIRLLEDVTVEVGSILLFPPLLVMVEGIRLRSRIQLVATGMKGATIRAEKADVDGRGGTASAEEALTTEVDVDLSIKDVKMAAASLASILCRRLLTVGARLLLLFGYGEGSSDDYGDDGFGGRLWFHLGGGRRHAANHVGVFVDGVNLAVRVRHVEKVSLSPRHVREPMGGEPVATDPGNSGDGGGGVAEKDPLLPIEGTELVEVTEVVSEPKKRKKKAKDKDDVAKILDLFRRFVHRVQIADVSASIDVSFVNASPSPSLAPSRGVHSPDEDEEKMRETSDDFNSSKTSTTSSRLEVTFHVEQMDISSASVLGSRRSRRKSSPTNDNDIAATHAVRCGIDWLRFGLRATATSNAGGGGGGCGGGEYWSRDAVRFVLPSASVGVGLPPPPPPPPPSTAPSDDFSADGHGVGAAAGGDDGEGGSRRWGRRRRTHVLRRLSISAGGDGRGGMSAAASAAPSDYSASGGVESGEGSAVPADGVTVMRLDLGCRQLETLTRRVAPDATRLADDMKEFARGLRGGAGGVGGGGGGGGGGAVVEAKAVAEDGDADDRRGRRTMGGTTSRGGSPAPPRWRPPAAFPLSASLSVGIAVRVHHGEGRGGGGDDSRGGGDGGGGGGDDDELRRISLLRRKRWSDSSGGTLELRVAVQADLRHDVAGEPYGGGRGRRSPVLLQIVRARVDAHASMRGQTALADGHNTDDRVVMEDEASAAISCVSGDHPAREEGGEEVSMMPSSCPSGDEILRLSNVGLWLQRSLLDEEEDADEGGDGEGPDDVGSGFGYHHPLDSLLATNRDGVGYLVAREDASITVDHIGVSIHPLFVGAVAELKGATLAKGPNSKKRAKKAKTRGNKGGDPPVRTVDLLLRRTELLLLDGPRLRPTTTTTTIAPKKELSTAAPAPYLALRALGDGISASVEVNATDADAAEKKTTTDLPGGGCGKGVASSIAVSSNLVVFAISTCPPPIPIIPPPSSSSTARGAAGSTVALAPSLDDRGRSSPPPAVTLTGCIGEASCSATVTESIGGGEGPPCPDGGGGDVASGTKTMSGGGGERNVNFNVRAGAEYLIGREHAGEDVDFARLSSLASSSTETRHHPSSSSPATTKTVVVAETRRISIDAGGSIAPRATVSVDDEGGSGTGTDVGPPSLPSESATRMEVEMGIVAAAPVAVRWCSEFQWNVVAATRTAKRTAEYCKGLLLRDDVPSRATVSSSPSENVPRKKKMSSVIRVRLEARDEVGVQVHAGQDSLINVSLRGLMVKAKDVSGRRKPDVAVSGDRCVVHFNEHDPPVVMVEEFSLEDEFRPATEGEVAAYESKRCPRQECPEDDRGCGERGVDDLDSLVVDGSNRPLVECIEVRVKNIVSRVAPDLFFGQVLDDIVLTPKVLMEGLSRVGLFTRSRRAKRHHLMAISASIGHIDASILEDVSGEPPRTVASSNLYYDDGDYDRVRGDVRSSSSKSSAIHRLRLFVREIRANVSRKSPPSRTRHLLNRLDSDPRTDREYGKMDGGDDVWVCVDHAVVIVDPLTLAAPLAVVRNLRYEGALMLAPLSPNTLGLAGGRLVHIPMSTFSSIPGSKERQGDSSTTIHGIEIRSMGIPPKVYLDGTLKLEEVISSFGAEVEAVIPKLIAAIDRVQPPKPPPPAGAPKSPPPGWWDNLRFFIHGNLRACVGKLAFRWLLDSVQVPEWSILLQSRGGIELRYTLGRIVLSSRTLLLSVPRQAHPLISEYAETNDGEEVEDISQQRQSLALIPRLDLDARLDWIVERSQEASPLEHHCPYLYYSSTPPEKKHDKFYRFRSHGVNIELDASVSGDVRFANWFALRVDVLPWLMHRKHQIAPADSHDQVDECPTLESSEIALLEQRKPKPPTLRIASISVRASVTDLHAAIWYGPDETNGVCLIVPSAEVNRTSESCGGDEGVDRQADSAHTEISLESVQAFLLDVNSNSADDIRSKRKEQGNDNNATTLSFVPSSKVDLNALDRDDRSTGIMGASPEEHVDILERKRRYANLASLYEYENQGDARGIFFLLQVWSKSISDERYLVEAVSVVVTDRSMDDALLHGGVGGVVEKEDCHLYQHSSSNEEKSVQGAGNEASQGGVYSPCAMYERSADCDDVAGVAGESEPSLVSNKEEVMDACTGKTNQQQRPPWTILVSGMKLLWTLEIRDAVVLLAEDLLATAELMKLQVKMNNAASSRGEGSRDAAAADRLEVSPYDDSVEMRNEDFGDNESSKGFPHDDVNVETPLVMNSHNDEQPRSNLLKLLQQNSSVRRSSSKSNAAHSEYSGDRQGSRQGQGSSSGPQDSFPIIQVRCFNPQIQLYSEATGGSIIMAMYGAYVEGLEFIRLFADYSGGGGCGSVREEFDEQGDKSTTTRNFPRILRKKQFKYTLDRVEVFALNSDVDIDAGLQWLKIATDSPIRSGDATTGERDHEGTPRGIGSGRSSGKAGSLFNSRNFYHVPGQSLDSQERMMKSFDRMTEAAVTSASSFGDPLDIMKEELASEENLIAAEEKRAALPSLKERHTARDFEPPILLRKIVDRFSFQTRQFMFRTPLDMSRNEIRNLLFRGRMSRVGGRFGTVTSIMDTVELRLDVLSFILDSYQFHTTIDVVRSVLLAPPPTSRRNTGSKGAGPSDPEAPSHPRSGDDVGAKVKKEANMSFDTEEPLDENGSMSLLGSSVNFDDDSSLSSCSTGTGLTSTDGDLTLSSSQRRYTSPEEKLEKVLKKWHASRKRKRMRNALRVSVEELLDKLVDQRDEANGVRNIKWNLCKASWKIYTPEFLDDVEIELTGLRGQHEFSSAGSMVTELELEDLRVNSLKPAPDSMCFDDPTAVVTTSLGADRSPCDNCEEYFDRADNGKDSCRYHGDPYGNLGTFLESSQRWSCCGQTWRKAPGCVSSPHSGRERVALVRLDTLPRPVQGITLYNHVEVNIYPEVPHTIIVQMTKSVAILLKSYFIGDGASARVTQAESAIASSTVGVIADDATDTARSLPSDDGLFSQQVMFARDAVARKKQTLLGKPPTSQGHKTSSPLKAEGRAVKAASRNNETDDSPSNKKDEEVIFIKRWCVGYVNTEISLAGFPVEAMRYGIKVPAFVRNYKIGPGNYLLRKYLSLFIHEVVKSVASSGFSKVRERIKGQTDEKQMVGTDRSVAENDTSELDEDAKKSLILGDHGMTQARSKRNKIKKFLKKPRKKT